MHKIPNLSEHFIYFNDDVFLGNTITPTTLFTPDGKKIIIQLSGIELKMPILPTDAGYDAALKNTRVLLKKLYGKEITYQITHQCKPFLKSCCELAWQNPEIKIALENTSKNKFRKQTDIHTYPFGHQN